MVIILAGNIATGKTTIARRIMALAPAFFLVGIDTATPTGKMIIGLFAVLAEYDREEIVQKSRNGQRLAQANGNTPGSVVTVVNRPQGFPRWLRLAVLIFEMENSL